MSYFHIIPTHQDSLSSLFTALSSVDERDPAGTSKQKQQSSQHQPAKKATGQPQCRGSNCQPHQRVYKRIINPSFDVSEAVDYFVLEGELPGVSDKSSISITFEDVQTIVIRGEVRPTHAQTEPQEQTVPPAAEPATVTPEKQLQQESSTTSASKPEKEAEPTNKTLSVTVEEVADESETSSDGGFEVVEGENTKVDKGKQPATKTAPADVEMTEAVPAPKRSTPRRIYWVTERSVGVFERKFVFRSLVDTEAVKATLEHGLLTVVVPKRKPFVRKIQIE